MDENVRRAFEEASSDQIQAAVDAADGRPEVKDIWIYTSRVGGFVSPYAIFGDGRRCVSAVDLDSLLADPVGSSTREWQMDLTRGIMAPAVSFVRTLLATGVEPFTRMVLHYDVAAERMAATFSYNQLDPSILAPSPLFEKWFENARATGDFSADATTVGVE